VFVTKYEKAISFFMISESNYWLTTVRAQVFPELSLPARVDVAVIGGGFSGLSAALCLAKAGARVAVNEVLPIVCIFPMTNVYLIMRKT